MGKGLVRAKWNFSPTTEKKRLFINARSRHVDARPTSSCFLTITTNIKTVIVRNRPRVLASQFAQGAAVSSLAYSMASSVKAADVVRGPERGVLGGPP